MRAAVRWVSILGHPFVMAMILVAGAALHFSTPRDALRTVLLVSGISVLPVAVLMVRQVRKGSWDNVDASNRAERPLLFTVLILGLAVLLGVVLVFRSGSFLVRGIAGTLMMLAVSALATRWVKVSLHMAFAAFATTALLYLGSPAGWMLLAFLPLLAWSRLAMGRHQPVEVAIGLLVGAAFGYAVTVL